MSTTDGPTFSADEPQLRMGDTRATASSTSSSTMRSLRERRSGGGASQLGLDLGTITNSSRDGVSHAVASTASFRGWSPTNAGPPIDALLDPTRVDPRGLRIVAYNILAARYTSTDKYVQCPVWALEEPYRLKNIVAEIRGANPDIVVLTECSTVALHSDELGRQLSAMGYAFFHVPITMDKKEKNTSNSQGSGTWIPSERPEHEGVAIVWRANRFQSIESLPVRYNTLAQRDADLQPEEKRRVSISSHNVAAVCVLTDTATNTTLLIGGIHCYWDTAKPGCQLYQIVRLLQEMEKMEGVYSEMGNTAVFVAGDFNCEYKQAAMQYMVSGTASCPACAGVPQFAATRDATHSFALDSAYVDYCAKHVAERHVSAVGSGYSGVIDHIFYQPRAYRCLAVGKLAPPGDIPNATVPSDHYPVSAWFLPY
jgi:mRNA deadenylase 3'-5' endonuclease subunit Ccr4